MPAVFKNFPVLQTSNLVLRQLTTNDKQALFNLFSDPAVSSARERHPFTVIEESSIMLKQIDDNYRNTTGIRWGIEHRETSELIGTIGLKSSVPISSHGEGIIRFELVESERGKGYMTEALKPVVDFAMDVIRFHKLSAEFFSDDEAIPHLLSKVGFELDFKEVRYNASLNSEVHYTIFSIIHPEIH